MSVSAWAGKVDIVVRVLAQSICPVHVCLHMCSKFVLLLAVIVMVRTWVHETPAYVTMVTATLDAV